MKINKKLLIITISFFIPLLLTFIYGAYITGRNADRASDAITITLPGALAFHKLEMDVLNAQKWITYTCATRAEEGFDNGFVEAEKYYKQTDKSLKKLREIFKDNPEELNRLQKIAESKYAYYNVGYEVAQAYIEDGTFYGNEFLNTFSYCEIELNDSIHNLVQKYNKETVKITQSVGAVLNNTKILFISLIFLAVIIAFILYLLMTKRVEIKESNIKLSLARDQLWQEMQIAKKIQTDLLPENPKMLGYDLSCYMMPASDVGGDYYDIINVEGKDWVIIGDVSGHGVTAGLIMMMAQTSIQTVLRKYPDMPPSEVLTVINWTIAENIRRLEEDKYMTITVLACHKEGKFTFSGCHQDLLVYRRSADNVEMIETKGLWLGIIDDLRGKNKDETFRLNSGDMLLLYTDGITEAKDLDENLFSDEKLADTFCRLGKEGSVDNVKNGILQELDTYKTGDDVTMVVLKRT